MYIYNDHSFSFKHNEKAHVISIIVRRAIEGKKEEKYFLNFHVDEIKSLNYYYDRLLYTSPKEVDKHYNILEIGLGNNKREFKFKFQPDDNRAEVMFHKLVDIHLKYHTNTAIPNFEVT